MAVHVVFRPTAEVTTFLASMSHRAVAQPPAHHQSRRQFPNRTTARDNASRSPCVATSVAPAAWPAVAGVSAASAESGHCPSWQPLLRQPRPSGRKPRGARTATRNDRLLNCSACGFSTISRGVHLPSIHVAYSCSRVEQLRSRLPIIKNTSTPQIARLHETVFLTVHVLQRP